MKSAVDAEVATLRKRFSTVGIGANIGTFTSVLASMHLESAGSSERPSTFRTDEGSVEYERTCVPLVGMLAPMVLQVSPSDEATGAAWERAWIWSLARMSPHVSLQITFLPESFVASNMRTHEGSFARL